MAGRLKTLFPSFITSTLDSYTQVFFSNNRVFAVILIAVSFLDFYAGLAGIISVVISNIAAYMIGLNRSGIKAGYYGFNSLLVGMGMGIYYQPAIEFYVFLVFASLLTLFLTVMAEGVIGKYGLPFMSISFLLGIWLLTLASRQFTHLKLSETDVYMMNDLYDKGGLWLVDVYNRLNNLDLPPVVTMYFRSLGAIFFQQHLFAGVLISIGLLIYSRISFMMSWTGFLAAWGFHLFIGSDISVLSYGYIGFNYILTAIAVGGFFLIPSVYSFLWVILLTPLIAILQTSSVTLLSSLQLPVFSLPFNVIVLLFLYLLKFRERFHLKPALVVYQQYSPEKNLYSGLNYTERFGVIPYLPLSLPFLGKWKITQGEDGDITHKGEWRSAWDFEIEDEKGKTFGGTGLKKEDYYCFGKPVFASADGIVEEILDEVEDNNAGEINIDENWGNAVVIKHAELLYSQVCHLKKDSIKVSPGDHVKKGDLIASCGNSGRSPYPHLHFQVQSMPFIGSKTLSYPLGHYLEHSEKEVNLRSFEKPGEKQSVSNIEKNALLQKSFHFIPGQRLSFTTDEGKSFCWEVKVDYLNNSFLLCTDTGSKAFFRFDGHIHIFTHFEGDKKSVLYMFYLGAWKVVTGFYPCLKITDHYPLNILQNRFLLFIQDFTAPFVRFLKTDYTLEYVQMEDHFTHASAVLRSSVEGKAFGKSVFLMKYNFNLSGKGLESFSVTRKNRTINVKRDWE